MGDINTIKTPEEHHTILEKLSKELNMRKKLEKEFEESQIANRELQNEYDQIKEIIGYLPKLLEDLKAVSEPLHEFAKFPGELDLPELPSGDALPSLLYIVYYKFVNYINFMGDAKVINIQIIGDESAIPAFQAKYKHNQINIHELNRGKDIYIYIYSKSKL